MAMTDIQRFGLGAGAGNLLGGLAGMFGFGNKNPADTANKYVSQIPNATAPYYAPWLNAGMSSLPQLQGQYSSLIGNPGGKLNEIGSSFHESPGFKFALDQALQGAGHQAAAGGMAGSPEHQQHNMELATNLANQDYYNYLSGATGLYGQGLQGLQGLSGQGQQAGQSLADQVAQSLAQQGNYGYEGQAGKNAAQGGFLSNLGSGLGLMSAFLPFL
jgi:hypothetical protein